MNFVEILYLTLPAFIANMLPVFATKINFWRSLNFPVDGGKMIFRRRIFGENKSIRGLVVGTIGGAIVGAIQFLAQKYGVFTIDILESFFEFVIFGTLAGFGALVGDLAGSFLKRLFHVAPGRPFLPLDQIDYIFGFWIFTTPLIAWEFSAILFLLIFVAIVNPLVNLTAYFLRIKKTFW